MLRVQDIGRKVKSYKFCGGGYTTHCRQDADSLKIQAVPAGETGNTPNHLMREEFIMKDCTNNGCQCTPNQSINCTVNSCAHHCKDSNYCGLSAIRVGTHETNPTEIKCTDCQSFELK